MEIFRRRASSLESRLRNERPQPSDDLIQRISEDVASRPARRRWNLGLAFALTTALIAAFALTGGMSYAASAVSSGTTAVKHLVTGKSSAKSASSLHGNRAEHANGASQGNGGEHGNAGKGNSSELGDNRGEDQDEEGAGDDQYREKVLICHHPPGNPGNAHTISVSPSAVPAHLAHGDTLGPCPVDNHGHGHQGKS